jgi:hypothetical protein
MPLRNLAKTITLPGSWESYNLGSRASAGIARAMAGKAEVNCRVSPGVTEISHDLQIMRHCPGFRVTEEGNRSDTAHQIGHKLMMSMAVKKCGSAKEMLVGFDEIDCYITRV